MKDMIWRKYKMHNKPYNFIVQIKRYYTKYFEI